MERQARSRWTWLLGAGLAVVAIASLFTFATLASRTSLRDTPDGRIAAVDPSPAPEEIVLPTPTPTGGGGPEPVARVPAAFVAPPPVDAPDVDPTATPTFASAAGDGKPASPPKKDGSSKPGLGGGQAEGQDHPGRSFASGDDKPGKGPKPKAAKPEHAKPAQANGNKHGSAAGGDGRGRGKGHSKGRGKGHAKHGDD